MGAEVITPPTYNARYKQQRGVLFAPVVDPKAVDPNQWPRSVPSSPFDLCGRQGKRVSILRDQ